MPHRIRTLFWKVFNVALFSSSVLAVFCILISRGHYLIDVILAYYVTTRVFWIYHTLAYNHSLRVLAYHVTPYSSLLIVYPQMESPSNYLSNVCWWPLFKYFEVSHHYSSKCPSTAASASASTALLGGDGPSAAVRRCACCGDLCVPIVPRSFEWPLPWPRALRRRSRLSQRLLPTQQA